MKRCSYCGKEHSDEASVCAIDGEPLMSVVAVPIAPTLSPSSAHLSLCPAKLHLFVSAVAVVGSFMAWLLWTQDWEHQLLGEEILWSVSTIIGFWGAIDAIRFDRFKSLVTAGAALLCIFHLLSFMLLWAFMAELTGRWGRWS